MTTNLAPVIGLKITKAEVTDSTLYLTFEGGIEVTANASPGGYGDAALEVDVYMTNPGGGDS